MYLACLRKSTEMAGVKRQAFIFEMARVHSSLERNFNTRHKFESSISRHNVKMIEIVTHIRIKVLKDTVVLITVH